MTSELIIDRRPEQEIMINEDEVKYFFIDFKDGDSSEKINKREMRKRITDKLNSDGIDFDGKVNVRFSKNYCETQRKGDSEGVNYVEDRNWQSWNSIDLAVEEGEVSASSNYAFVIPWARKKKYVILFFSKSNFNKLIKEKENRNSYFDYVNAQEKQYRKFYFYFTYQEKEKNQNDNGESDDEKIIIQQVSFFSSLIHKLRDLFHKK